MERILLVRHGQSEQHVGDITGGWTDTALTDLGRRQAARVAERLAGSLPDSGVSLFSSDLARASGTATSISERIGVEVKLERGLRELDNGAAAGLTQAEAKAIERPVSEPTWDWVPYQGAESWGEMTRRVYRCMDRLTEVSRGTAIVVTHGNSGDAVVRWWLRLSAESPGTRLAFSLDPASISVLEENATWGERVLVKLNDTSHLEGLR